MRRPLRVAASALALFGASPRPGHAEATHAEPAHANIGHAASTHAEVAYPGVRHADAAHADAPHADSQHAEATHALTISENGEGLLSERFRLGDRDSLVVSRAPNTASVAVCVADHETLARGAPDPLELARRGGTEREERRGTASFWCAALPASELAFAMWLAGHLRSEGRAGAPPGSEGAAPEGAAERKALSLSMEGAIQAPLQPPRRVISVAGDVHAAEVSVLAGRYLGAVSPTSSVRPTSWSLHQTSERLSVIEGSPSTPQIHYGWAAGGRGVEDIATLRVAFEILAGSDTARLPRLLVPRGLARHVGAWSAAETRGTLLGVAVETTSRTSVDRVRRFIDGSLKQLRLVGPSEREVARAVAVLRRRALETWEDLESRARTLAEYELTTGDAEQFARELESVTRVRAERVRSTAHELLTDAHRTTIETYPALWPTDDPALARHQLYTVAAGDTLGTVAARFHADPARLAKDNDLDPRYRLMPGQPLWIAPATPVAP